MNNKEYEKLLAYLNEILHKLQDHSCLLHNEDISLCLSDEKTRTNNAKYDFPSDTIIIGLNYLKRMAQRGEDAVAMVIAHELSHKVFRHKYLTTGGKEEEIYADNYGLILCYRAGYSKNVELWNDELSADINEDVHPQHKIRQLILRRTSARLGEKNVKPTLFREPIPQSALIEYCEDLMEQRKKYKVSSQKFVHLYTDIDVVEEESNESIRNKIRYVLSLRKLNNENKFFIYNLNLKNCDFVDVVELYKKIKQSPTLFNERHLMKKFRDNFIWRKLFMEQHQESSGILKQLDSYFVEELEKTTSASEKLEFAKYLLKTEHRFSSGQDRQKVYDTFVEALKKVYGADGLHRGIESELGEISGKIHNSDVLPFVQTLKNKLNIDDMSLYALHNFVKSNSFEVQQIRAETLITECLLNPEQALKTVKYLIRNDRQPFRFKGIYDKSSSKVQYSYIDDEMLKDIHDDLATVPPEKRADFFVLLMENIPAKNAFEKLELMVDKKDGRSLVFEPIMREYLNTYSPAQQNAVVATLVSQKELNEPLGYEECFKIVLKNSGIAGRRVYNDLYKEECPEFTHRNYEPLYAEGDIIYSNLHKLGQMLMYSSNKKVQEICKCITRISPLKSVQREMMQIKGR